MTTDNFNQAMVTLRLLAGGLYGGQYEPKSDRDVDLADALMKVHKVMEERYTSIRRGHSVKVVAGFNVGARGIVEFVEPSGEKIWVLRDGASTPVFYHPEELKKIDPAVHSSIVEPLKAML